MTARVSVPSCALWTHGPPRAHTPSHARDVSLGAIQVHECFCVVKRGNTPCAYLGCGAELARQAPAVGPGSYFNAGLIVLRPNRAILTQMQAALWTVELSALPFAEQDFLNTFWAGAWEPLPWVYNSTKGLYASHRDSLWDFRQVKNLHFTMAKPWDLRHPCHAGFERLNELWWAAFSEPGTLCRMLLKLHLNEKRTKEEKQKEGAASGPASERVREGGGGRGGER